TKDPTVRDSCEGGGVPREHRTISRRFTSPFALVVEWSVRQLAPTPSHCVERQSCWRRRGSLSDTVCLTTKLKDFTNSLRLCPPLRSFLVVRLELRSCAPFVTTAVRSV
ncbi:unnamed protein product, partial [Scytosiphon promiscuus]